MGLYATWFSTNHGDLNNHWIGSSEIWLEHHPGFCHLRRNKDRKCVFSILLGVEWWHEDPVALYNVKYQNEDTRPGKLTVCYGKSPFLMGKYGKIKCEWLFSIAMLNYHRVTQDGKNWKSLLVPAHYRHKRDFFKTAPSTKYSEVHDFCNERQKTVHSPAKLTKRK